MKTRLLSLTLIGFLSACSNEHIDAVQNLEFEADPTFTVEQALTNRKVCDDEEWSSFEEDRGRVVVEYSCSLEGAAEFFEQYYQDREDLIEEQYDKKLSSFDKKRDSLLATLKDKKSFLEDVQVEKNKANQLSPTEKEAYIDNLEPGDEYFWEPAQIQEEIKSLEVRLTSYSEDERIRLNNQLSLQRMEAMSRHGAKDFAIQADEIHQWVITPSEPVFLTSGVEFSFKSKPSLFRPFGSNQYRYEKANKVILENKVEAFHPYYQSIYLRNSVLWDSNDK